MLNEHERVILLEALPAEGLEPGDVGVVVHVYPGATAYEVEFTMLDGHTAAVATLESAAIRPVTHEDITHARVLHSL